MDALPPSSHHTAGLTGRLRDAVSHLRRSIFFRNVGSLWSAEVVIMASGFLQAVFVARWLGPTIYGSAALVVSYIVFVYTFFDPRSETAVVKYLSEYIAVGNHRAALATLKVAYGADFLLGIVGFAIIILTASRAQGLLHLTNVAHLFVVLGAASALTGPAATSRAILMAHRRFLTVGLLRAGEAVGRTALILLLVGAEWGIDGFIYGTAAGILGEATIGAVLAHRTTRDTLGGAWWQASRESLGSTGFREIVRFMVYTDLSSLASAFAKQGDVVILGFVRGPTEAGYYRLAQSVASPLARLVPPLQSVVYPRVSTIIGLGEDHTLSRLAWRHTKVIGAPLAAAILIAVPVLPSVVTATVGHAYSASVHPAQLLLVGAALALPLYWVHPFLLAGGHVRFLFITGVVISFATVVAFLVLGDLWGASGIAAARSLVAGLGGSLVLLAYFVRRSRRSAVG